MRVENPLSVDWTTKGAVSSVKDQGGCGSCWAFSAVEAVEGAFFIKYKTLYTLSYQQVVSCDTSDQGCNGGWMTSAFNWIKSHGGITTNKYYPYTSGSNGLSGVCNTGFTSITGTAPSGYNNVAGNVVSMESATALQPLSIAIDSSSSVFQSYSSGIITTNCAQALDHGVLLVGYGSSSGTAYWKVQYALAK